MVSACTFRRLKRILALMPTHTNAQERTQTLLHSLTHTHKTYLVLEMVERINC
jgi:hypothetical protein